MSSTVIIFDPNGVARDVPYEQLHDLVQKGAVPGVNFKAPDGTVRPVPANRVQEAVQNGGKILPFQQQDVQHPGFWKSVTDDVVGMGKSLYHAVADYDPLTDPNVSDADKWKIAQQQSDQARAKMDARTQQHNAVYGKVLAPAGEMLGVNVSGMEKSAEEGDAAGVVGHAVTVPATLAATEGISQGVQALPRAVATLPIRFAARAAETAANQKAVPLKPLLNIMTPADAAEAINFKVPGRDYGLRTPVYPGAPLPEAPPTNPGAPLPATPPPEVLNPALVSEARTMPGQVGPEQIYGPRPVPAAPIPARPGLALAGEVAPPPAAAAAAPVATPPPAAAPAPPPPSTSALLEQQLNEALGGKPLAKGVPLRNQFTPTAEVKLPEGFTPVDSQVLKGYKYDPATREFESITNSGQHYVHGDVSPEQAANFEATDSKGTAWNALRKAPGVTRVAQVVNGERIAAKPPVATQSASPTDEPAASSQTSSSQSTNLDLLKDALNKPATASSSTPDLLSLLKKSLAEVKSGQPGVMTTAAPADLLKRWGVDEESLASGREQTRGMSADETEDFINKLAQSYKKGKAVEPVLETRDADNNIVSVDGRARAIAAQRAGIERVPIRVRRLTAKETVTQ
jgi:hypothetical protein